MCIRDSCRQVQEKWKIEAAKRLQDVSGNKKLIGSRSFDPFGMAVEIKKLNILPELAPKLGQIGIRTSSAEQPLIRTQPSIRVHPKTRERKELLFSKEEKVLTKNPEACTGLYDALVPAAGVTFSEIGKNPKMSHETMSQQIGKMRKTELQSLQPTAFTGYLQQTSPYIFGQNYQPSDNFLKENALPKEMDSFSPEESLRFGLKTTNANAKAMRNFAGMPKVEICGDLSQLLVNKESKYFGNPIFRQTMSIIPKTYVPPLFRAKKPMLNHPGETEISHKKSQNDLFNMGIANEFSVPVYENATNSPSVIKISPQKLHKNVGGVKKITRDKLLNCLLYTSPSPRDLSTSRMPSSA
eukprot:TRINITY_DN934_c0_g1_i2.p1 TRINITY_DN934_c0_g1~~TRINITY_DN934_c0_g1_i2.p1  ORF type:complete len:354 (+),score=92.48 TRINITY_DN934_c0_g1_i2:69-1130(+)